MWNRKILAFIGTWFLVATAIPATTFPDGVWYPEPITLNSQGVPAIGTQTTIDATGEKHACIFRVSDTGTITDVGFRIGTVTTPQSLDVTLQTVSAVTGTPNGSSSLYGGSSSGTINSGQVTSNTARTVTLGTPATATAGDIVAAVVEFSSTTGNLNISGAGSSTRSPGSSYAGSFIGTPAWTKVSGSCILWLKYNDGTYKYNDGLQTPQSGASNGAYTSASNPNERALKFSLPAAATIAGASLLFNTIGPSTITFYDSDGTTALQTVDVDTDTAQTGATLYYWAFASPVTVLANTFYRVGVKASTTTNVTLVDFPVTAAAVMGQMDGGTNMYLSTRQNTGAWTDTTTTRPYISLRLVTAGSSSGPKSTFIFE